MIFKRHRPGPGTKETEETVRVLPDGTVVKFILQKEIWLDEAGKTCKHERLRLPTLRCGCAPLDMRDVRACYLCGEPSCAEHTFTTSCCRKVVCSSCSVRVGERRTMLCRRCRENTRDRVLVDFFTRMLFPR